MTAKCVWCGVLIIALSVALAGPANAQGEGEIGYSGPVVGPIVGAIAAVAVVTVVVIHYSKKTAIAGCVNSWGSRITFADEKDKQIYALSGDTADIKPGDRIKLPGKKVKLKGPDKTLA